MASTNNKLTLSTKADQDIKDYIRMCDYEIGGFGYVTMDKDGNFLVDDVFLVKQTVTGTSVDFMDEGLDYAIQKAATDDRLNDLKFCWHSHVDMGAFWSATDDDMIEGMNNGMTPYIVSLVQNKSHQHEQRVDFFPSQELGQFTDQVTYELDLYYIPAKPMEHTTQHYNDLVTRRKPQALDSSYSNNGCYYNQMQATTPRELSEKRKDYLHDKVVNDGYKSLSHAENTDYEQMLAEDDETTAEMLSYYESVWDDDLALYAHGQTDIDFSPLVDLNRNKDS